MSATGAGIDPRRLLGIYLDDHLAVLVGGSELLHRTLGETKDDEIRSFLEQVLPELEDDRAAAERIVRSIGRAPNRLKQRLAWVGEKAGRLKLNGAVKAHSRLSRLVELEGIAAILGASHALWTSLAHAGPEGGREEAARRAARAGERLRTLDALRLPVAGVVFGGGSRQL
jgi:hypothetical protein